MVALENAFEVIEGTDVTPLRINASKAEQRWKAVSGIEVIRPPSKHFFIFVQLMNVPLPIEEQAESSTATILLQNENAWF